MTRIASAVALFVVVLSLSVPPANAQTAGVEFDTLTTDTSDPIAIEVADDGRVIWIEREGGVNVLSPDGTQVEAGRIPVSAHQCGWPAVVNPDTVVPPAVRQATGGDWPRSLNDGCAADTPNGLEEGGLMGLLLAHDFNTSGVIYLYRSVPGTYDAATASGIWRLSTFVLGSNNRLDMDSEQVLFETRTEWTQGHHYGGGLNWMPDGTMLMSMGDDTRFPSSGGYGPRDYQQDYNNAETTSMNPSSRSGKLLRLNPDGTVPDGSQSGVAANPFLVLGANGVAQRDGAGNLVTETMDNPYICLSQLKANGGPGGWNPYAGTCSDAGWPTVHFDPYVYSLGWKQPWRGVVFPDGSAFYGDVGPDAGSDDPVLGPRGYEEWNAVPAGGGTNYGWPRCQHTVPYGIWDWGTSTLHGTFADFCANEQVPATFWYTGAASTQWPSVGTGGKTSEPVIAYTADIDGPLALPAQFDNTVIALEFSRNWVKAIPFDPATYQLDVADDSRWIAITKTGGWKNPTDAVVGPDGAVYFAEHTGTYWNTTTAQISRMRCAGCAPASADLNYGLPLAGEAAAATATAASNRVPTLGLSLGGLAVAAAAVGRRRRRSLVT